LVGYVFQAVDLDYRRKYGAKLAPFSQMRQGSGHVFRATHYAVGELLGYRGYSLDLVDYHQVGYGVDKVGHVVNGAVEADDVLAVHGGDECVVELVIHLVADFVAQMLKVMEAANGFLRVLEIVAKLAQHSGGIKHVGAGIFEPLEEVAVVTLEKIE
jgi:hypothetical protein